jgi:hypothetical protein
MWIGKFIIIFAAGLVGANAVPHFVKGITGQRHQSPMGKPSSAVINVVWGALNLLGAFWLGIWACTYGIDVRVGGSLAIIGALVSGVGLALGWQNDPVARGEQLPAPLARPPA